MDGARVCAYGCRMFGDIVVLLIIALFAVGAIAGAVMIARGTYNRPGKKR